MKRSGSGSGSDDGEDPSGRRRDDEGRTRRVRRSGGGVSGRRNVERFGNLDDDRFDERRERSDGDDGAGFHGESLDVEFGEGTREFGLERRNVRNELDRRSWKSQQISLEAERRAERKNARAE